MVGAPGLHCIQASAPLPAPTPQTQLSLRSQTIHAEAHDPPDHREPRTRHWGPLCGVKGPVAGLNTGSFPFSQIR